MNGGDLMSLIYTKKTASYMIRAGPAEGGSGLVADVGPLLAGRSAFQGPSGS